MVTLVIIFTIVTIDTWKGRNLRSYATAQLDNLPKQGPLTPDNFDVTGASRESSVSNFWQTRHSR
jgi:hypothetical protein